MAYMWFYYVNVECVLFDKNIINDIIQKISFFKHKQ